jgi:hypothetical protein
MAMEADGGRNDRGSGGVEGVPAVLCMRKPGCPEVVDLHGNGSVASRLGYRREELLSWGLGPHGRRGRGRGRLRGG